MDEWGQNSRSRDTLSRLPTRYELEQQKRRDETVDEWIEVGCKGIALACTAIVLVLLAGY